MLWQLSAFLPSGSPTAASPNSTGLQRPDPRGLGSCSGRWSEGTTLSKIWIPPYSTKLSALTCWHVGKKKNWKQNFDPNITRWCLEVTHVCCRSLSVVKEQLFPSVLSWVHFKVIISSLKGSYLLKTIIKVRWWKMTMLKIRSGCSYLQVFSGCVWLCQDGKTEPNGFN